jgi:membrane-bound metal-dependent hydrolase YbcI (DUF457 family)
MLLYAGLGVALAVAPDLDVIPGLLVGQPALYHAEASHSLGAALAVSAAAAVLLRVVGLSFLAAFLVGFLAYGSHLALDMVGVDGRPPFGIPLLWPLSDMRFISPVPLLPGVRHAATASTGTVDWLQALFSLRNVIAIGIEVLVTGPLLLLGWALRRRAGIAKD